ncbi:MAG TPA: hypothetical protein VEU07_01060 [Candidatus Acidoferrum sp.]|nr:hypothetical protein [Candidatus Acidoferrum sp.]
MIRLWTTCLLLLSLLAAPCAIAGDLASLRRAAEGNAPADVERWLAEGAKTREPDPLADKNVGRPDQPLLDSAGSVNAAGLTVTMTAMTYVRNPNAQTQQALLRAIDQATGAQQQLETRLNAAQTSARQPGFHFTQLYTAANAQSTAPGDSLSVFAPTAPIVYVRFAYTGGTPGETLIARWRAEGPQGAQDLGQNTAVLQKPADAGQFSYPLRAGSQWTPGAHRVTLMLRDRVVAETGFVIETPAAPRRVVTARPQPMPKTGATPGAPPAAAPNPAATGPVRVLEARTAKGIASGDPKDPTSQFTSAARRVVLWTRVQAPSGGSLTARWYATQGTERLLAEHVLEIPAGDARAIYWLETAAPQSKLPVGPMRVDLLSGNQVVKSLALQVQKAGFLDELAEGMDQFGSELEKSLTQMGQDLQKGVDTILKEKK